MTVVPGSQANATPSSEEPAEGEISLASFIGDYRTGGMMGLFDRVGNAMQENISSTYSAENMNRMSEFISQTFDEILEGLPAELREGLTQFFNMITGAADATPADPAATAEADMTAETYGAGSDNPVARAASNLLQRDENSLAAQSTIGGTGGAILNLHGNEIGRDGKPKNGEEDEGVELMRDAADAQEQAQEEMRRWQESTHRMGNIVLTGEEWGEFADMLSRDTPQRRALVDDIRRRDGLSETQAQRKADEIALLARMQSMPESQWTPQMRALDAELDANPQKRRNFEDHLERANDSIGARQSNTHTQTEIQNSADTAQSIDAGADLFASAPDLTAHHAEAVAATAPLDARPQPAQIAISTPTPASPAPAIPFSSGGFDG
jgi:hypothetical protein